MINKDKNISIKNWFKYWYKDAYNAIEIKMPWDFRKERCVRTLVSFLPEIKNMTKNNGVAHDALADCHFQIKYCSETYRTIKNIN